MLGLINTGEISPGSFLKRGDSVSLTPEGRKVVISAYQRRLEAQVTHPIFGYTISYRRVLEVQTRLVTRWLTGEVQEYPPFRTR